MKMSYIERLVKLQKKLNTMELDAFIQPVADEFLGEYTPPHAQRLHWITGFAGSAGLGCIITDPSAQSVLFTDGRYIIQANEQIDNDNFIIHNISEMSLVKWLGLQKNITKIGYDAKLHSHAQIENWQKTLGDKVSLVAVNENPIDSLWDNQPDTPSGDIIPHSDVFSGEIVSDKMTWIENILHEEAVDALFCAEVDNINWLLNIRGSDIPYNPLFLSMAYIKKDGSILLGHYPRTIPADIKNALPHVEWMEFDAFQHAISKEASSATIILDSNKVPSYWYRYIADIALKVKEAADPITLRKAIKNDTELSGIRDAHMRDGLALTRFLCWLNGEWSADRNVSELQAEAQLEEYRAQQQHYRGASFATIAGAGEHGAIVHYRATEDTNRIVHNNELFLLDSGGQYVDGTTDVTRTMVRGTPSSEMKEAYTYVLKGHISITNAVFPRGTTGAQLDVLARQYLWKAGMEYDHGTGHGVGHFLCVHEGPQGISKRASGTALQPGMVLSNEPGYYKTDEYGIRIENLVEVVESDITNYLTFRTLTLAPLEGKLIIPELLTIDEKRWINAYHASVLDAHIKHLSDEEANWLIEKTRMY